MNQIDEKKIPLRIKKLRQRLGVTLDELGAMTNFTKGYLSQLENSGKAPPISTLARIASALNADPISFLTGEDKKNGNIKFERVRKNERKELGDRGAPPGYSFESLAYRMFGKNMEPSIVTLTENTGEFKHEGEEFIYVLKGKVELFHGDETYLLEEGDSAYFDSGIVHGGRSLESKTAKLLVVMYFYKRGQSL